MVRNLIGLFVLVVLAIWGFAWYHTKSVEPLKAQPLPLFHWADTTNRATIRQAIQTSSFKPVRQQRQNFGHTESIHWFRFRLTAGKEPKELTLDAQNHTINYLDFMVVQNGKLVALTKTGDWLPFGQRPVPTKTFAFPIYLNAYQTADYYLRADERYENLATQFTLWRTSDFEDREQRHYFLWGIFAGVVVLIVLINLIFWSTTDDVVYVWYAIYVMALSIRQAADSGLGFQYIWPTLPILNAPDPVIQSIWLYVPALLQFQQYFLNLRQEHRWLFRATQVMKYSFCTGFFLIIVLQLSGIPRHYPEITAIITCMHASLIDAAMVLLGWTIVVSLRSGDALKQVYAVGLSLQLVGQIVTSIQSLMRNGAYRTYFIDPYLILTVVFFIDLVVFAYLLAYRYRQSISQNQQLVLRLAQTQQEANQSIIEVLDAERQQVYNLLLFEVGQHLRTVQQLLKNEPDSALLTDSVRLIQKVDTDLAHTSQNRLPVAVAEKGLTASLSNLIHQLNLTQTVLFTWTQTGGKSDLSVNQEVALYRIANELMNNILKHAQATQAQVTLVTEDKGVSLRVSDNGRGFDVSASLEKTDGIGVKNLQARAHELQADLTMDSDQTGTTIVVFIPQKIQTC